MESEQHKARVELAASAIFWLLRLKGNECITRKDLFIPSNQENDGSPWAKTLQKEIKNKEWQNKFLDFMTRNGFIEKSKNGGYSIAPWENDGNWTGLNNLFNDFKHGGEILSRMIEGESLVNSVIASKLREIKIMIQSEQPEKEQPNMPRNIAPIPETQMQLEETQHQDRIEQTIVRLIDAVFDHQKTTLGLNEKMVLMLSSISKSVIEVDKTVSNFDKQMNGLKKRIDDLEKIVSENRKLAESDHKLIKDFTSAPSPEKIFESAMVMMKPILNETQSRIQEVGAVREAVEKLFLHLKAQEDNTLQKAIKQLNSNLEEGKALQEVLLQITSK